MYYNENERNELNSFNNYNENTLKLNLGKLAIFHMTFPGTSEPEIKKFRGILEEVNNDYIVISSPSDGKWYFLILAYLNFIEFEEAINCKK